MAATIAVWPNRFNGKSKAANKSLTNQLASVAQLVEQLTLNSWRGFSPNLLNATQCLKWLKTLREMRLWGELKFTQKGSKNMVRATMPDYNAVFGCAFPLPLFALLPAWVSGDGPGVLRGFHAQPCSPAERNEVLAQVGLAVWQTQILERAVGFYLVLVHQATPAVARSEVETMFAKAGKNTLGQLLRIIQATKKPPKHLVEQLDMFVQKRNWLVHHSRHESHSDMNSALRRSAFIAKIDGIAKEALELMVAFQAVTEAHLETLGISKEQIDRDSAKIMREWTTTA